MKLRDQYGEKVPVPFWFWMLAKWKWIYEHDLAYPLIVGATIFLLMELWIL